MNEQINLNVWALAGELGMIITLPLVILILLGIKIDRLLGTTPLCIIIAMLLSFVISSVAVWRKVKTL